MGSSVSIINKQHYLISLLLLPSSSSSIQLNQYSFHIGQLISSKIILSSLLFKRCLGYKIVIEVYENKQWNIIANKYQYNNCYLIDINKNIFYIPLEDYNITIIGKEETNREISYYPTLLLSLLLLLISLTSLSFYLIK